MTRKFCQGLFLFCLLLILCAASTVAQNGLGFIRNHHDFGDVPEEGKPSSFSFRFGWKGKGKLKELKAETPCSCTTVAIFGAPWDKGDSGWVKVTFDPHSRPGPFEYEIELEGEDEHARLTIRGFVVSKELGPRELYPFESGSLRFRASHLTFGRISDHETDTLSTPVFNQGKKPVKIDLKNLKSPKFAKVALSSSVILPNTEISLSVVYDPKLKKNWGFLQDTFYFLTNDIIEPKKMIVLSADIEEDFSVLNEDQLKKAPEIEVTETEINLGKIPEGKTSYAEIEIRNQGINALIIRRVYSLCSCLNAVSFPKSLQKGETGKIKVQFVPGERKGAIEKTLEIISNDPLNPVVVIKVKATLTD